MNNILVTESSQNIRRMAREALAGKWKVAAVATLVYFIALMLPATILNVIFGGADGVSGLASLYTFLVTGSFTLGYSMFCMNLFRNREIEVSQVFYGFERFGKTIGLYFMMCLFIVLWLLLFIVPGIIAAYRYSQAFLVMVDHPEYGIMQCIEESKRMMRGNKMKYFCLDLSFIGWALLAVVPVMILGGVMGAVMGYSILEPASASNTYFKEIMNYVAMIGYIWLTPYVCVAGVGFYEMANGNLRPGIIEVDAKPISNESTTAETFVEDHTENILEDHSERIVDGKVDEGNKDQL